MSYCATPVAGDAARQVSYAVLTGQFDWSDFVKRSAEFGAMGLMDPTGGVLTTTYALSDYQHPPGFTGDVTYNWKSTALAAGTVWVSQGATKWAQEAELGALSTTVGSRVVGAVAASDVPPVSGQF